MDGLCDIKIFTIPDGSPVGKILGNPLAVGIARDDLIPFITSCMFRPNREPSQFVSVPARALLRTLVRLPILHLLVCKLIPRNAANQVHKQLPGLHFRLGSRRPSGKECSSSSKSQLPDFLEEQNQFPDSKADERGSENGREGDRGSGWGDEVRTLF